MPDYTSRLRSCCLALILPGLMFADEPATETEEAAAAEGYFISQLAQIETLTTGIHELSKLEQANLENLIAYEVDSARAGGVNGFAGGFSDRRSAAELEATGIDRMSDEQRVRLDEHIAGFLADQPISYVYRGDGHGSRALQRDGDPEFEGNGPLLEVHGSVTMTVGGSSAGTFYGGSATTVISDPKGRFNAVISYGTMKGNLPSYDTRYRRGQIRR